jgi:diguanylate cyclase (GGDEF)-like protein/PAS domain S-box-containing protein
MRRLTPVIRISVGLVGVTLSILLLIDLVGLLPEPRDAALDNRMRLAEVIATQVGAWDPSNLAPLRAALEVTVQRNEEVLSAGLRGRDGRLLLFAGDHAKLWDPDDEEHSSATHVRVPIGRRDGDWARLELRFAELGASEGLAGLLRRPLIPILGLLGALGFVGYLALLRRALRHLDPSAVIPTRLQRALNVMVEGVLIVAADGEIVLANSAFARRAGRAEADLLGTQPVDLDWRLKESDERPARFPWQDAVASGETVTDAELRLVAATGETSTLVVNVAPVLDGWDRPKGAIVTFADVTQLEQKSEELGKALAELEKSRDEIRLHNEELQVLATIDPLTGVSNRRSFFKRAEEAFRRARAEETPLSVMMVDIDHFKRINDRFGHAAGDEVLCRTAELLREMLGFPERVCRYGGEEFCVELGGYPLEQALGLAEQIRAKIDAPAFTAMPVTASFGVASFSTGAADFAQLVNQADDALYRAKRTGRNRVCAFDGVTAGESEENERS